MKEYFEFFDMITELAHLRYSIAEKKLKSLAINHTEARILSFLSKNNGCRQDELSASFFIDRSNVGRSLKSLESKGYIRRKRDDGDLRSFQVYITSRGKPKVKQVKAVRISIVKELCKKLSKEDAGRVVKIVNENLLFNREKSGH